jgi:NADPH:quinone reductase-like Zn-dependent oxidoreductase
MKAVTLNAKIAAVTSIPVPPLSSTHLLVKVHSVALNPADWKHIAAGVSAEPFSIVGCDYAGTVVAVGSDVKKPFKVGDKVYGCTNGCNQSKPYDGVFAEYALVKGDVAMHVPKTGAALGLEDLCTVPLGSITVGQGLFQPGKGLALGLPEQGQRADEWVLIYGGSTATGSLGIQFAKLAGYKVITTCSPKNNAFVKSRGADEVFDYNDPECGAKIRELTRNKLRYAWNTIGHDESSKVCDEALSTDSAICHYGTILRNKFPREDVMSTNTVMYTMFGEEFVLLGTVFPASEEDYGFGKMWMGLTEKFVAEGKIKPHPKRVRDGGLEAILTGLKEIKEGKVSGEKLVYPF